VKSIHRRDWLRMARIERSEKIRPTASCESQSASSCSSVGESNFCSDGAGRDSYSDVEVKVTELCEPTGDVMY